MPLHKSKDRMLLTPSGQGIKSPSNNVSKNNQSTKSTKPNPSPDAPENTTRIACDFQKVTSQEGPVCTEPRSLTGKYIDPMSTENST